MIRRPEATEHDAYFGRYIDKVPEGDILEILEGELQQTLGLLASVPAARETYRYAEGKWSIREVIGHLIDSERLFQYRALCFARRDPAHLPTFDEDEYARQSNAHGRPLAELAEELESVRRASLTLFRSFDEEATRRTGKASVYEFSVRSFPYIIAGHEVHHRGVIEDRYLTTP
jgi:uncharacterized damage-inducible protein DinB